MKKIKSTKKIRDQSKYIKDFNDKSIKELDINKLEHKKDYKEKLTSENTRFDEKIKHKKSRFLKKEDAEKTFNDTSKKKLRLKAFKENSTQENIDDLKENDITNITDAKDNSTENVNESTQNQNEKTLSEESATSNEQKVIVNEKNKRKNYLKDEIFTRDTHSKKVDKIIQKSKENASNKNLDNLDDALFLEDKKIRRLKYKKESLLHKKPKDNLLKKSNQKMFGVVANSSSLLSSYVAHGSDENVGADATEKSLDKVSYASGKMSRSLKDRKSNFAKNKEKSISKLNHKLKKRQANLEYKEHLKTFKESDVYKQKTTYQKFIKRKQMKKSIYKKYKMSFKDRFKKKSKEILSSFSKTINQKAKKIGVGLVVLLMLFVMIFQLVSSIGSVLGLSTNSVLTTSYLSDESVLSSINQEYSNLEYNLQDELDSVEANYPDYDEYIIKADEIGHNTHELLSYITARYGEVKDLSDVRSEILNLFNEVYKLDYKEEIEIRYRREYYTYTDEDGNVIEESFEVPYEYKKLFVTLKKNEMDKIIRNKFTLYSDNLWHYETLLQTKGNMELVFGSGSDYSEIIQNPNFENPGLAFDEETAKRLFNEAEKHIGKRYVFGANGPANFDCSSFVCYSFTHSGIKNMPRTTAWRIYTDYTVPISPSEAKAGDIIFFKNTYNSGSLISHVGIYAGGGMMIHAGDPIQYTSINSPYWREHFYGFGRPR